MTEGRFTQEFSDFKVELFPTSDGKSFYCVWKASAVPRKWIVSLHGAGRPARGFATDDVALSSVKATAGQVMLHGFSRGSANSYAVAAIDSGRGKHYVSLVVASSGGVSTDYPPTAAISNGEYGKRPLANSRWVSVAGARDPHPERDGIAGMRTTSNWLREQGAVVVESIEDQRFGHGALMMNPENTKRVLDRFLTGAK